MSVPQGGQKAHHQAALAKTKTIPFGSEIRQAAVAAALRRHAESGAGAREQDLSARAVHIAALLAFRRLLADCRVPFGIRCPDPLAACPRFEISLGGLPVLLARSRDPAGSPLRLTGPGNDWNENDRSGNRAIVLIYTAAGSGESGPIPAPGPFAALMPAGWSRPRRWAPREHLRIRLESPGPARISLTGLDRRRCFRSRPLLVGNRVSQISPDWHTLSALCTDRRPTGRLRIFGPRRGEWVTLQPGAWRDLGSALSSCRFLGYTSLRALQGAAAQKKIPISSLDDLFARVREWNRSIFHVRRIAKPGSL